MKPEAAGADSDGKDRENRVLPAINMQHEHPERQNVSQKEYVEKKIVPQQKEDVDLHRRKRGIIRSLKVRWKVCVRRKSGDRFG